MRHEGSAMARAVVVAFALLLTLPDPSAAQRRNREGGDDSGSSGQAVPRQQAAPAPAPAPAPSPSPARESSPAPAREPSRAVPRSSPRTAEQDESNQTASSAQSAGARSRQGQQTVGVAVPRGSVPRPRTGPTTVFVPVNYYRGYWPWGYGGLGFGSYYGSYYGGFYDPYYPWYGGYGQYGYYGYQTGAGYGFEGSLRLKYRPRDAQVFVDGYYVGIVDEFDGVFQRLRLESGPHRIEIRAPGYETMTVDVRIRFDDTTTLEGQLRPIR
jgi:hypothetical protein